MQEVVLRRLELIRQMILLEDLEDIELQIQKLRKQEVTAEVTLILDALADNQYSRAAAFIESLIHQDKTLTQWQDPEAKGLKIEVRELEKKLSELTTEKSELDRMIYSFNTRYQKELGALTLELLQLKIQKMNAANLPTEQKERILLAEAEYQQAKSQFESQYANPLYVLTDAELADIKLKYRKACKLCHPDVVAEPHREKAQALFAELQTAYEHSDLAKVTQILEQAEKGFLCFTASETVNDKSQLKTLVVFLKRQIEMLVNAIFAIKKADVYQLISKLQDWDSYFKQRRLRIQAEIELLRAA
jgi:phage tail protein X